MYSPIQTDLVVAVRDQGYMFVTGPDVIKEVTGEDVSLDELGGADEAGPLRQHPPGRRGRGGRVPLRPRLPVVLCPPTALTTPPIVNPGLEPELTPSDLELDSIVPDADNTAYDMHEILLRIFDDGEFFDVGAQRGLAIITAFARVDGRPVGVIANQPMYLSGSIDNEASDKAARIRPVLRLVQSAAGVRRRHPGRPARCGAGEERHHQARRAVTSTRSWRPTCPKVTITIRKSYGGGYAVMGSKQLSADFNFAWPTARIAVIGAEGAAQLLMKRFPDPTAPEAQEIKRQFIDGYNLNMAIPWIAAERGYIDA